MKIEFGCGICGNRLYFNLLKNMTICKADLPIAKCESCGNSWRMEIVLKLGENGLMAARKACDEYNE